jgi:hypothetical protein
MSLRVDSSPWISGALLVGDAGLGVLGSEVPASGENGAGYLYNDLSLPADADKEVCGRITTWPSAGTLYAYEDSSFTFTGAPDGSYSFAYQLYVDGVATGSPTTATLEVGAGATASLSITTASDAFAGSASVSAVASLSITGVDDAFSGGAVVSPVAALVIAPADDAFAGSAGVGTSCSLTLVTAGDAFAGSASGGAACALSLTAAPDAFAGSTVGAILAALDVTLADDVFSGGATSGVVVIPAARLARVVTGGLRPAAIQTTRRH